MESLKNHLVIVIALEHYNPLSQLRAVAVFRTLEGLIIAFFTGFSNAASILVGKEVGAGNHELAYQRAKHL